MFMKFKKINLSPERIKNLTSYEIEILKTVNEVIDEMGVAKED